MNQEMWITFENKIYIELSDVGPGVTGIKLEAGTPYMIYFRLEESESLQTYTVSNVRVSYDGINYRPMSYADKFEVTLEKPGVISEVDRLLNCLYEKNFFESWEYFNSDKNNDREALLKHIGFAKEEN